MLVGREPAKMRPSKDLTTCGRWVLVRPGSSSVMAGLSAFVLPGRVDGRPEDGSPGHPRRPVSAGKQSGGSATENPTPAGTGCPRRGSAREGDHTREGQPAGRADRKSVV